MALRYSFDLGAEATRIEKAVEKVLADGVRTADLLQAEGDTAVSTTQMGDAILAALSGQPVKHSSEKRKTPALPGVFFLTKP
jgi:isocitrate/isopropylmalate dehydrogenase